MVSIASLQRLKCLEDDVQLHVYTDQKKYFQELLTLPVIYHEIDSDKVRIWRGDINFIHRVKIKVLQHVCSEVREGLILYLDTDVLATGHLETLWQKMSAGVHIMHTGEGKIYSTSAFKKIVPVVEYAMAKGLMKNNDPGMWNAGVLGFRADQSYLLEEVLTLTDKLYAFSPKHIIEQLGFSYIFQQNGHVLSAENLLFHYWNLKEFREILKQMYRLPPDKRDTIIRNMLQKNVVQQLLHDKGKYYKHPFNKLCKLLFNKKWMIASLDQLISRHELL
jgi:hypothetical protein